MLEKKLNSTLNVLQLNLKHGDIARKYMRFSLLLAARDVSRGWETFAIRPGNVTSGVRLYGNIAIIIVMKTMKNIYVLC